MPQYVIKCNNCQGDDHRALAKVRGNRGNDFISRYHNVVICKNCGLVFLNPQHDEEDYAKYYARFNTGKIDLNQEIKEISPERRRTSGRAKLKDFLIDNIDEPSLANPPRLLDVGCGKGIFLHHLKDSNFILEGLEPGKMGARFARERFGFKINECMLSDHNLPEESFDVVTALAMIEHVNDPLKTLKTLWKLLKPGGYVLLTTPNFKQMALTRGVENYFKFVHTFYYTDVTLSSLMKQAGFKIVKIWYKDPILKDSPVFGTVRQAGGLLAIIGRKIDSMEKAGPMKEDVSDLIAEFNKAKKRDRWYSLVNKLSRYYCAGKNIIKNFYKK